MYIINDVPKMKEMSIKETASTIAYMNGWNDCVREIEKETIKTEEEIIVHMLKTIQDLCNNSDCIDCPLGNDQSVCKLQDASPDNWDINGHTVWRALK